MTRHTPGYWHANGTQIIGKRGKRNQYIADVSRDNGAAIAKANAVLIAQAPAMLEALELLFEHCVMIHKHWGEGCNQKEADAAIKNAQAILAKLLNKD
jgi:hypothetical protein